MNTNLFPTLAPSSYVLTTQLRSPVSEESVDLQQAAFKPVEQVSPVSLSSRASEKAASEESVQDLDSQQLAESRIEKQQQQLDEQILQKLATLDREVRNHERAHAAVGGQYAGAPRYEYERGPDGVNYAVAGEVPISTGAIPNDPQMTIEKAQVIRRAALAPAEPSAQDRKVAAEAAQMEAAARVDLVKMEQEQRIEEQQQREASLEEGSIMNNEGKTGINSVTNNHEGMIFLQDAAEQLSVDDLNETQESAFNEINNELTSQLIALGGRRLAPQSLGNIINRLI